MREYRERAIAESAREPSVPAHMLVPSAAAAPAFMHLYSKYGFSDADMQIGASGPNEQSVDEEYCAYVKGPHAGNVDILKFWEVGDDTDFTYSIDC